MQADGAHAALPLAAAAATAAAAAATAAPTPAHRFVIRPLRASDHDDLAEMARHTYSGHDYICAKLPHWMQQPHLFACLAVVYQDGQEEEETAGATSGGAPSAGSMSLLDLHCAVPPVPPRTFAHMDDGRMWTHEELRITARREGEATADPSSPLASPPAASPSAGREELRAFRGRVVAMEVLSLLDAGSTAFLMALRVHPALRGFGLASLLHARLLHLARRVYGVRRARETTAHNNRISRHLAQKHDLQVQGEYDCVYFSSTHARDVVLPQLHRQLAFLGVQPPPLDLQPFGSHQTITRGSSTQVRELVARHIQDRDLSLLRIHWMMFEPTEANLVHLCTEAVLQSQLRAASSEPSCTAAADSDKQLQRPGQSSRATAQPHFLAVSPLQADEQLQGNIPSTATSAADSNDFAAALASASLPRISAFSLALVGEDHTSRFRAFSIQAPHPSASAGCSDDPGAATIAPASPSVYHSASYRHALLHLCYQLTAAAHNRHETAAFDQSVTDATARSASAYTTAPFGAPIGRLQLSLPRWFTPAFTSLQDRLAAAADRTDLDPPAWSVEAQMLLLERRFE